MLTFEQIKELIDQVASHRLSGFELERSGFRLKIDGQAAGVPAAGVAAHHSIPAISADGPAARVSGPTPHTEPAEAAKAEPEDLPADAHNVSSPIVGTFYRAPNPDSAPYVEVGDRVKAGQVLCIIEAMKLMNEIESDIDGTIVAIHIESAQPVEYGEPLFAIKAD